MLKKMLVIMLAILLSACSNNEPIDSRHLDFPDYPGCEQSAATEYTSRLDYDNAIEPSHNYHNFTLTYLTHDFGTEFILQLESVGYSIGEIYLADRKLIFDVRLNAGGGWERDLFLLDLQSGNISMTDNDTVRELRTSLVTSHTAYPYDVRIDSTTYEMHILLNDEVIISVPPLQLAYGHFHAVLAGFIDENTFAYHFYSGLLSAPDARVGIMSLDGSIDVVFEGWYYILTRNGKTYIFEYPMMVDISPMDGVWHRVDEHFNLQPTEIQNTGHIQLSHNGEYLLMIYGRGDEAEHMAEFRIYNFLTEELVHQIEKPTSIEFTALRNITAVSNCGNAFAYIYLDGKVYIYIFD